MLEARSQGGRQEYSAGKQGVRNLYRSTLFLHWLFIHLQYEMEASIAPPFYLLC